MMDAIRYTMHGPRLGQRGLGVHHAVDHLADSDVPPPGLRRLDMRPFRIGQVARIAVVARAVVGSPHGAPQEWLIQLFKRGRDNRFI